MGLLDNKRTPPPTPTTIGIRGYSDMTPEEYRRLLMIQMLQQQQAQPIGLLN